MTFVAFIIRAARSGTHEGGARYTVSQDLLESPRKAEIVQLNKTRTKKTYALSEEETIPLKKKNE